MSSRFGKQVLRSKPNCYWEIVKKEQENSRNMRQFDQEIRFKFQSPEVITESKKKVDQPVFLAQKKKNKQLKK